ncbi:MAG: hypothetical protein OXI53_11965 [Nitrospira sp.]|nr:hypothetical protein [Nitrospira sp.]MDE0406012.1 hypothetical protein [Nitrospira sp.]MDE0486746.1 hypothetical protein [Nitrospira sp.]
MPGHTILKTYDLARALRNTDVTLIGGFQSPMEKDFLDLVLRGTSSVVVCPARGLDAMRIPKSYAKTPWLKTNEYSSWTPLTTPTSSHSAPCRPKPNISQALLLRKTNLPVDSTQPGYTPMLLQWTDFLRRNG